MGGFVDIAVKVGAAAYAGRWAASPRYSGYKN
jgi:hypothetical protein